MAVQALRSSPAFESHGPICCPKRPVHSGELKFQFWNIITVYVIVKACISPNTASGANTA